MLTNRQGYSPYGSNRIVEQRLESQMLDQLYPELSTMASGDSIS